MQAVGRYRLQGELGRGANGVVYRAWDPERGEDVAVKVLTELDGKKRKRFATEVRTLARLRHPHLVTILAYGEHQGHPYLVMELVRGGSLQGELEQRGPMSPGRAVELTQRLAQAVAYAHSCAVIHRDIKPDNVLLTLAGEPKLTDFGLARDMEATHDRLTRSRASMGTPGYWAPEQAAGKNEQIGEQTDVYGLGATLYAMLTGGPPIQGRSYLELVQRTMNDAPIPPRRLAPDVWPALEAVCLKALAKAPEDRFGGATALARAVQASLTAPAPGRRVPWPLVAAAGGAAVVAGVVWLVWASAGDSDPGPAVVTDPGTPEASPLLDQGARALEAKDFEALRAIADQLLVQDPDSAWGRLWRGVVRQADGALDQARDDLSAAYAQPETTQRAALELARLNLTQGDYPAAEDWARRTRELDPEGDDPDWVLAQALLGQERADEALAALAGPSERDGPRQAEALMLRGEILLARGRVDEGEDALRRASEVSDHPGAYLRLAHLYVQTGRGADAERAYTQALERTDEPAIVLVDRARFRLSTGDREGALGDARRAVELDPKHPQPRVTLGRVLFIGFQQGGEALEELRRALELQADFPPALYASAEVLYDALNCEGALRLLDRLLKLEPTHSDGHFLRAMTHSELEDVQAAARDFDAALRLEQGRSALTFSAFATLLREHGQFHEALGLYDQALAVDPGCGPAHYGRGLCLMFARGARAEAIQALRQGLPPGAGERGVQRHWVDYLEQLPPEAPPLAPGDWLAQAEDLLQREEFVSAALCFSHALDLGAGGQRGRARRGLAECLLQAGDPQAGEQELTRALWAGAGPEALLTRGLVRHARGDLQGALRDFERILQRDPAQPDALLGRGMAFAQLGELERAAGDFASYVRLVPDRPEGWSNLAVVTYKLDDCETAVQAATRALELTPDDAQLIALRGAALRKLGDLHHARADLDRVLSATPEPEGARLERMVVAQQQGDHATAIADGRLLLERDPMHLTVRMALAESLAADGQRAEALRLYDDTLERLDPAATVRAEVQRLRDQLAGAAREDE